MSLSQGFVAKQLFGEVISEAVRRLENVALTPKITCNQHYLFSFATVHNAHIPSPWVPNRGLERRSALSTQIIKNVLFAQTLKSPETVVSNKDPGTSVCLKSSGALNVSAR